MRDDLSLCPEFANRPRSLEGFAVAAALDRASIWKTAGMAGVVIGLDMSEALASIADDCDRERARLLFMAAEPRFVAAFRRLQDQDTPRNG